MDLSTLISFLATLATLWVVVFGLALPWLLAGVGVICLGVELHYREITRLTSEDWPEPIYATSAPLGEVSPIWEQVQPDWRVA